MVVFQQATESFSAVYLSFHRTDTILGRDDPVTQPLVIAFGVIMLDELADGPT